MFQGATFNRPYRGTRRNAVSNDNETEGPGFFKIIDSAGAGAHYVGINWRYVFLIGWPAMLTYIATTMYVLLNQPDAGAIEVFIWQLPAHMFLGWAAFNMVRLVLMGEKLQNIPIDDQNYLQDRAECMTVSVISFILIQMAITLFFALLELVPQPANPETLPQTPPEFSGLAFFLMIMCIALIVWLMRFMAMPAVTASGYSPGRFLAKVRGWEFSLRILVLYLLCSLPVVLLKSIIISAVNIDVLDPSQTDKILLVVLEGPSVFLVSMIFSAAVAVALKDVLGQNKTANP